MLNLKNKHKMSKYCPLEKDAFDPIFEIGDVVRYDSGSTALFQIEYISKHHGGMFHRYYGQQCFGGTEGRYQFQIELASEEDLVNWNKNENWRRPFQTRDRGIIGSYED